MICLIWGYQIKPLINKHLLGWVQVFNEWGFPGVTTGKEPACNVGDIRNVHSITGSRRSSGGEHGNPLQYSCLEKLTNWWAWWSTAHRVTKSLTWLKQLKTHTHTHTHTYTFNEYQRVLGTFINPKDTNPWTAKRSNQSILKEISPEYSFEGLMLKLKLQYFGHLMQRAHSLEKTPMLGKIEGRKRRGRQRMKRLDGITNSMDMFE